MNRQISSSLRETRVGYDIVPLDESDTNGARETSLADILAAVADTAQLERGRLNGLSSFTGDGAYGDRIARAFGDAATAVVRTGTGDLGDDLELVGQVLGSEAGGRDARYLAQGFLAAAPHFAGRKGLSVYDLGPLLAGLLEGAAQNNPAQPGQGTMLDVLVPAQGAYNAAVARNLAPGQTVQALLGAANAGAKSAARMSRPAPNPKPAGREDPSAVATQVMLTGIVKGLLGRRVPPTPAGQSTDNFILALLNRGIDLFDLQAAQPESGVNDMLSRDDLRGS